MTPADALSLPLPATVRWHDVGGWRWGRVVRVERAANNVVVAVINADGEVIRKLPKMITPSKPGVALKTGIRVTKSKIIAMLALVSLFLISLPQTWAQQTTWAPGQTTGTIFISDGSRNSSSCELSDRTPTEQLSCKVEFWKKEVDRVEKSLAIAKERLDAFRREEISQRCRDRDCR